VSKIVRKLSCGAALTTVVEAVILIASWAPIARKLSDLRFGEHATILSCPCYLVTWPWIRLSNRESGR
jgi:hypothetical protein